MSAPTQELPAAAATPAALIARVRAERAQADRAEATILQLALEWAHAHPLLPGDESWRVRAERGLDDDAGMPVFETEDEVEDYGIPEVHWCAIAPFAAANAMSTTAGRTLIRDALILCHRLPRTWTQVTTGRLPAWRARRIARAVIGAPADVVESIDDTLVTIAAKVGPVQLDRLLDEAMLRLHAEDRELAQLEALDARHVTLDELTLTHTGVADLHIRGDWKDLHDFDQTLTDLAHALATTPEAQGESLEVRRSIAVGVIADPARAAALLAGTPAPKPRKRTVLHLHLSHDAVQGRDPVGRNETTGTPVLAELIRSWCARPDTHLTVAPVIDLNDRVAVEAYEIPDRLAERVRLAQPTCVFPWCTRPARSCDLDHRHPYDPHGGPDQTADDNLAPLCRHHHRLKTHAGWHYTRIEPGVHLWTEPHGQRFLRDHDGTTDLTPP